MSTLPTSGLISLDSLNVELGKSSGTSISLNDADVRALAGKPSGLISLSDFYGADAGDSYVMTIGYRAEDTRDKITAPELRGYWREPNGVSTANLTGGQLAPTTYNGYTILNLMEINSDAYETSAVFVVDLDHPSGPTATEFNQLIVQNGSTVTNTFLSSEATFSRVDMILAKNGPRRTITRWQWAIAAAGTVFPMSGTRTITPI